MKFAELSAKFIAAKSAAERRDATIDGLELTLNRDLGPRWGQVEAGDITPDMIEEWLSDLKGRALAPSSRTLYLARLRECMNYATIRDIIAKNPCKAVEAPTVDEGPPKYLSPEAYAKLWDAASPQLKDWMDFMTCTGARVGEMMALTVEQVTPEGILFDAGQKSRGWGYIPISPALRAFLEQKAAGRDGKDRLFPTSRQNICRHLLVAQGKCGVSVTPHWFRHTCATWLVKAGVSLPQVKGYLRHASVAITEVYLRIPNGDWGQQADKIPARTLEWCPIFKRNLVEKA